MPRPRPGLALTLCAALLILPGCLAQPKTAPAPQSSVHVSFGQAVVISYTPGINMAILRINKQDYTAWWDNTAKFFVNGIPTSTFNPLTGDLVEYHGALADGDLLINRLNIIRK